MGKNVYQQILNCKTACSPVLKNKRDVEENTKHREFKLLLRNALKIELIFCLNGF